MHIGHILNSVAPPSLQLVDASAPGGPTLVGAVPTAASPKLITWAPTTTTAIEQESLGNIAVPGVATQARMPAPSSVSSSG